MTEEINRGINGRTLDAERGGVVDGGGVVGHAARVVAAVPR